MSYIAFFIGAFIGAFLALFAFAASVLEERAEAGKRKQDKQEE